MVDPWEEADGVRTVVVGGRGRFRFDDVAEGPHVLRAWRHREDADGRGGRHRDRAARRRSAGGYWDVEVDVPVGSAVLLDIPPQAALVLRVEAPTPRNDLVLHPRIYPARFVPATVGTAWIAWESVSEKCFRLDGVLAVECTLDVLWMSCVDATDEHAIVRDHALSLAPGVNRLLIRADGTVVFPATPTECPAPGESPDD